MSDSKSGIAWTIDDMAQLEAMLAHGCSLEQMAGALGRTPRAVMSKLYFIRKRVDGGPMKPKKPLRRRSSGASFFLS